MNTKQTSEAGEDPIDYPDVPLSVALVNSNLSIQNRLWALQAINDRRDLRAQLAEAEKVNSEAWTALGECTCLMDPPDGGDPTLALLVGRMREEWKKAEAERDAAQARAGELEGVLREALPVVRSMAEWCKLNPTDRETRGLTDIADRIDAALATSPHRLAGRGPE